LLNYASNKEIEGAFSFLARRFFFLAAGQFCRQASYAAHWDMNENLVQAYRPILIAGRLSDYRAFCKTGVKLFFSAEPPH
jgi:hypothetical protein